MMFALFLTSCQVYAKDISLKNAQEAIKIYISSVYEKDYDKFSDITYAKNEVFKKKVFESLLLAHKCNLLLVNRFGKNAIEDFNLYKKGSIGISEMPVSIDYSEIDKLRFRKWKDKYGIFEPQTSTFFEFESEKEKYLIIIQKDVTNFDTYVDFIDLSIKYMKKVVESVNKEENKGLTVKEFANNLGPWHA